MILNYYLFKIEKDKPEMNVDKTVCYMNTIQLSKELNIKNEICPNPDPGSSYPDLDRIYQIINCFRIKTEHNTSSDMKVEADLDASTLHTEFDMKNESDASISNEPTSVTKNEVPRNDEQVVADEETDGDIFVCSHCLYATRSKRDLINHVKVHNTRANVYSCCYCNFRTNSGILFTTHTRTHSSEASQFDAINIEKKNDDNFSQANSTHSVAKYQEITGNRSFTTFKSHPDFIASVSRKVQECSRCSYKTIYPYRLRQHIVAKHPDIAGNRITNRCIYCNKTLTSKASLDDHVVKIHPDFITSVSRKVRECSSCTYKTIRPYLLRKHIVAEHPDIAGNFTTNKCVYCNKTFVYKRSLDDHIVKKHPDFIASVSGTVHKCTKCTYKTVSKSQLKRHMVKHHDLAGNHIIHRCIYCNKTFIRKQSLDGHIFKSHPDFIASVSRKVQECSRCSYKTIYPYRLRRHIVAKHPDIAGNRITNRCIYCNKTLTSKASLDDHIVMAHPDFIASVSRKVQECSRCTYKTILTSHLKRHILVKHPEIDGNRTFRRCIYCNKTFIRKRSLDDHIVKAHPEFIASVGSKVHECSRCTYKTILTSHLKGHNLAKHPDIAGNRVLIRCIYCNKTFTSKLSLDDHIVKKHPDFIVSVSRKVHECSRCTYKTILTSHLKGHNLAKHPDIAGNRVLIRCIYCNKTFTSKLSLDDHIVKKHPDFIASVSRKVHECSRCTYKTTFTSCLKGHIRAKHPDIAYNIIINRCIYCNKTFTSKLSLDDHIVKRHPDFIASVSRKVHECSRCTYKTIITSHLKGHNLAKHPDIAGNRVLIRCIYCKKTFTSKRSLEDHIVKTHPDFIASVSSKIHECRQCTYKTTNIRNFREHSVVKHPEISDNCTFRCTYCNKTFKFKQALDDHIIEIHPDFIACVSRKVHECKKCTYKTVSTSLLKRHMVKHPDIAGNHITIRCNYCNKTFTRKQSLDDHIVRKHPDFIASVSRKVYECTKCTYKTVNTGQLE
nr:unnamed protein product [Callosobruchus analis]